MRPWRFTRSVGVAVAGGAFLVGLLVVPAPAIDQDNSSDATGSEGYVVRYDGDWVTYDRGAEPHDGRVELVRGEKGTDGACQMSQSASSETHVAGVHGVEIAFNPETCESKYLIRELNRDEVKAVQMEHSAQDQPATYVGEDTAMSEPANQAAASKSGWTQSWYEDPPGWDVTYTFVRTTWNYNGSCVTGATGKQEHRHMSLTGWTLSTWAWNNVYNCTKSSSNIFAAYQNNPFCPGSNNTTYNTYNRTRVEGKGNGSTYWAWPATKSGGCSSLLSHNYLYGN